MKRNLVAETIDLQLEKWSLLPLTLKLLMVCMQTTSCMFLSFFCFVPVNLSVCVYIYIYLDYLSSFLHQTVTIYCIKCNIVKQDCLIW